MSSGHDVRALRILELGQATVLAVALASTGVLLISAALLAPHITNLPGPILPGKTAHHSVVEIGRSTGLYALYAFVAPIILALGYIIIGAVIAWRQRAERAALVFSLLLVGFGDAFALGSLVSEPAHSSVLLRFLVTSGFISLAVACYLFPDGRLVPGWTRWSSLAWLYAAITTTLFAGSRVDLGGWPKVPHGVFWLCIVTTCPVAQIYRYRHVSNPIQRQQTKWVALGLSVFVVALTIYTSKPNSSLFPQRELVLGLVLMVALFLVPMTVGLAMLRYRLWDVDVLINRTLVYGLLSVLLAVIYIGSVIGLQALFRAITGQQSNIAIAISTLAIAAAFNSLRHRVQDLVARTFYRRKYDAAKVLAAFGATCRDETDLEKLRENMLRVVEETVQPAHVSLWLRETPRKG